jgi:hypothetical protein
MLRPVVLGLEALTRATGENSTILQKLNKSADDSADAQKAFPQLVADLQTMVDQKNKVNVRMFDALHEELKGYKDWVSSSSRCTADHPRSDHALR